MPLKEEEETAPKKNMRKEKKNNRATTTMNGGGNGIWEAKWTNYIAVNYINFNVKCSLVFVCPRKWIAKCSARDSHGCRNRRMYVREYISNVVIKKLWIQNCNRLFQDMWAFWKEKLNKLWIVGEKKVMRMQTHVLFHVSVFL